MRCPFCNYEMKPGYLQSAREIFWTARRHKFNFHAGHGELALSYSNLMAPTVDAWHCDRCKKIVIDYNYEYGKIGEDDNNEVTDIFMPK